MEKHVILTTEWAVRPRAGVWGKVGYRFSLPWDLGTVLWSGIYTPRGPEASADCLCDIVSVIKLEKIIQLYTFVATDSEQVSGIC